jgi:hypothetical protein
MPIQQTSRIGTNVAPVVTIRPKSGDEHDVLGRLFAMTRLPSAAGSGILSLAGAAVAPHPRGRQMVNAVLEKKRAALLDLVKGQAWNIVAGQPGAIENWVVLIADGTDANARVLLRDLGVDAKLTTSGGVPSVVPVPRADAIRIIRPYDAELADKLATPTPMKATAIVVAFGGWSILGVGRNVGIALPAASRDASSGAPYTPNALP